MLGHKQAVWQSRSGKFARGKEVMRICVNALLRDIFAFNSR
jgi:hypothetical protein